MADVPALGPSGEKIWVAEKDVPGLIASGGSVDQKGVSDATEAKLSAQYDKVSPAGKALGLATGTILPPQLQAWRSGNISGLTAGLGAGVARQAMQQVSPEAAKAFAEQEDALHTAYEGTYRTAEVTGTLAGAIAGGAAGGAGGAARGLSRLLPSAGISAIGNATEQAVGRGVAGIAGRGALGRAIGSGLALGSQGAVEGALYGAAHQVGEDMFGDHELTAEKMFASTGSGALYGGLGGVALGAGGSLLKSGLEAGTSKLASVIGRGKEAAIEATEGAGETLAKGMPRGDDLVTASNTKARQVADKMAFDALGTTRKIADKVGERVSGGAEAVGNYVNRRIIPQLADSDSAIGSAFQAAKSGRADELLPIIQADKASIGKQIGDVVAASPARVPLEDVKKLAGDIAIEMNTKAEQIGASKMMLGKVDDLQQALTIKGAVAADGTVPLSELYYQRAGLEKAAYELGVGGQSMAKDAVKNWLRKVDDLLVTKLDSVAKEMGKEGAGKELLGLKREYHLASWAERAAEDGSNRISGNNSFGIRESIGAAAGFAMGHPIGALATALGGKLLRERGSVAGAMLLTKMADMGTITKMVRSVDDQIGRAAKGVLLPASSGSPYRTAASSEPIVARARRVIDVVRNAQANPEQVAQASQAQSEAMSRVAPNTAAAYAQTTARAIAYLGSQIPANSQTSPLRGDTGPQLSNSQAAKIVQLAEYVDHPLRFFQDVERGKVTPEGVEMAKILMPKSFSQLQDRTLDTIADAQMKGKKIEFNQRMRLSLLLDIQGDACLRSDFAKLLQENVSTPPAQEPGQGQAPKRPVALDTKPSPLDRLESR